MQVLTCKLPQVREKRGVSRCLAVLQCCCEVDLLARVGFVEGLGDGDVCRRGGVGSAGGGSVDIQRGYRCGEVLSAAGLVGRGCPSLRFGGLRLEGVEGEEAQVGKA
jgi:hypothetical protein